METEISIGLHSQTLGNKSGIIAGSEVTTEGLKNSFLKLPFVAEIYRYAPGKYDNLARERPDLIIIEGWDRFLPLFISKVRKFCPDSIILHWCLSFFGFNQVLKLNVDGYLCNSLKVSAILSKTAPTRFVMLASDTERFRPIPHMINKMHTVVFLGMYHRHKSNEVYKLILGEAIPFGLAIYGSGWDSNPTYKKYWKGILPEGRISELYNSAQVVLGITEERQRRAGMINNRVFEALSCGSCFVSDYSMEMENLFGQVVLFSKKPGDTGKSLSAIFNGSLDTKSMGEKARKIILANHSYDDRIKEILKHFWSLKKNGV